MDPRIQVISILGSGVILAVVFGLIRQRKLREEYALLWLGASILLIIMSLWRDLLETVARVAGVAYPPSVLFLAAIVLGFLLAMHFSVSLSRLANQNKRLTQELALLKHQIEPGQRQLPPAPTAVRDTEPDREAESANDLPVPK
jgi:hypothetical protein